MMAAFGSKKALCTSLRNDKFSYETLYKACGKQADSKKPLSIVPIVLNNLNFQCATETIQFPHAHAQKQHQPVREKPRGSHGERKREKFYRFWFCSVHFILLFLFSFRALLWKQKLLKLNLDKKSENSVFRQIYHLDYDFEFSVKQKKFLWFFFYFLLILHTHNTKLEYSEKFARQHANSMKFTLRNLLTVKLSKNIVPMKNIQSKYDLVYL